MALEGCMYLTLAKRLLKLQTVPFKLENESFYSTQCVQFSIPLTAEALFLSSSVFTMVIERPDKVIDSNNMQSVH